MVNGKWNDWYCEYLEEGGEGRRGKWKIEKLKIEKPSSVALDGGKIFFVFVRLLAPDEDLKLWP